MSTRPVLAAAVVALATVAAAYCATRGAEPAVRPAPAPVPPADLFADLTQRFRVEVRWDVGPGFFPEDWARYEARAEPIAEAELRRMPAILEPALARYPDELLARDLRRICLARTLSFYGQPFGGTTDDSTVYLSNDGVAEGFDDRYLAATFHHELSSILLRNHEFSAAAWRAANPEGFAYTSTADGGVKAIESSEDGLDGAPEYYEQGLLSQYAKADLEEDFNTYCEVMMTEPARLRRLAAQYPAIARKYALCRAFYTTLGIDVR